MILFDNDWNGMETLGKWEAVFHPVPCGTAKLVMWVLAQHAGLVRQATIYLSLTLEPTRTNDALSIGIQPNAQATVEL